MIDATIPNINFNTLLSPFVSSTTGSNTWCTKCAAFNGQCAMGCAGDNGGGGPCPADTCPRVFTFTTLNNAPVWNIKVATNAGPYRAFSYIKLCDPASSCDESFVFSFAVMYTPAATSAQSNFFGNAGDYLKLLFWGDGNNILGVKEGKLLGIPNGGGGDLVGSSGIGSTPAFQTPFVKDTWIRVAIKMTVSTQNKVTCSFRINDVDMGTSGTVGIQNSGLQFGAYVWGGTFFDLKYKDIAITKDFPTETAATTAPTSATTTAPTTTTKTPTSPATTATPTTDTTLAPDNGNGMTTTSPTTSTTTTTTSPTRTPTGNSTGLGTAGFNAAHQLTASTALILTIGATLLHIML